MLVKYCLLISHKVVIKKMLNKYVRMFWDHRKADENLKLSIEHRRRIFEIFEIVVMCVVGTVEYLHFIRPVFDEDNIFILETWNKKSSLAFDSLVLLCQYYLYMCAIPVAVGYDAIYLSLCIETVIQLQLLKNKLKVLLLSRNVDLRQMYSCVRHHQLLLS